MSGSGGERRRPLANTGLRFSPVEHEGNATTLGKWVAFIAELIGEILDTETTRIDVSAGERPIAVGLSWSSRSKRSADGGVDGRVYSPLPSPRASKHGDRGHRGGANPSIRHLRALKGVLDYDTALYGRPHHHGAAGDDKRPVTLPASRPTLGR